MPSKLPRVLNKFSVTEILFLLRPMKRLPILLDLITKPNDDDQASKPVAHQVEIAG
tara:strand:- start:290 stop:457 length:168 start_codon:yes stop_codon:yes gene_type:complete